jgi:hypothetical protein
MHLGCDTLLPTASTSGTNYTSAANSICGGTLLSTSSSSTLATKFSRWRLATSKRHARVILDAAQGSPPVVVGMNTVLPSQCTDWITVEGKSVGDVL